MEQIQVTMKNALYRPTRYLCKDKNREKDPRGLQVLRQQCVFSAVPETFPTSAHLRSAGIMEGGPYQTD